MKYVLISILIIVLGFLHVIDPLLTAFNKVVIPIQLGLKNEARALMETTEFVVNISKMKQINHQFKLEIDNLNSQVLEYKKMAQENKYLKEQLKVHDEPSDITLVLANVLGNPADLTGTSIYIDKGSNHSVSKDDMIILGNVLVGRVSEVRQNRSLVELIISPNVSMAAKDIDVPDQTEGIVSGKLGLYLEMNRILQGEKVNMGDTIVTSGVDGLFLPGYGIGIIESVQEEPAEPLKTAHLKPIIDLSRLDRVFVVLSR